MKLPHGESLTFAKELITHSEDTIVVRCAFPMVPTLAMFIEAGAQACAGFRTDNVSNMGFVSMVKNVKQLQNLREQVYLFKIQKQIESHSYLKVIFEASEIESTDIVVSGELTLVLKV